MGEQVFTNARLVLASEEVNGTLAVKDGKIHDVSQGASSLPGAIDLEGDILMPGMVELHTDNLEKHMTPRPKTQWPSLAAVIAHDSQIAGAGITTVFDAISIGDVKSKSDRVARLNEMIDGLHRAGQENILQADHLMHFRCEVSYRNMQPMLEALVGNDRLRMLSVMDHTPGQRQFVNLDAYYTYYKGKYNMNDAEIAVFAEKKKAEQKLYSAKNRRFVVELARTQNMALASHDDATGEHVEQAIRDGIAIAEFPTTIEAAQRSHEGGLAVLMGGPNLVRGGSHSGNVSAGELAGKGYLDIISSDYVPHSLLHGLMLLHERYGFSLPDAVATVTSRPAESAGLTDRGRLEAGKRADLLRVHASPLHPLVRGVWREGQRVS